MNKQVLKTLPTNLHKAIYTSDSNTEPGVHPNIIIPPQYLIHGTCEGVSTKDLSSNYCV